MGDTRWSPESDRRSAPTVLTCTQSLGAAGIAGGSLLGVMGRQGQGSEALLLPEDWQILQMPCLLHTLETGSEHMV